MLYPLRLIVSFACSYLFPRLNPHSLTVLLVQKKKNRWINNFKTLL